MLVDNLRLWRARRARWRGFRASDAQCKTSDEIDLAFAVLAGPTFNADVARAEPKVGDLHVTVAPNASGGCLENG
jgi:hypothetical protein